MKKLISHSATILPSTDIDGSITFYTQKLGFELTFTWENPVSYAVLNRDESVSIHLVQKEPGHVISSLHTSVYIFSHDIEALFQEFQAKNVKFHTPLGVRDYGMKDFEVTDPDGHILAFGQNYEEPNE